jgi:hypothetical protein
MPSFGTYIIEYQIVAWVRPGEPKSYVSYDLGASLIKDGKKWQEKGNTGNG